MAQTDTRRYRCGDGWLGGNIHIGFHNFHSEKRMICKKLQFPKTQSVLPGGQVVGEQKVEAGQRALKDECVRTTQYLLSHFLPRIILFS